MRETDYLLSRECYLYLCVTVIQSQEREKQSLVSVSVVISTVNLPMDVVSSPVI